MPWLQVTFGDVASEYMDSELNYDRQTGEDRLMLRKSEPWKSFYILAYFSSQKVLNNVSASYAQTELVNK